MNERDGIKPAFDKNNIPICFACNSGFHLYTSVAVQSIYENKSSEFNYDILILYEDLNDDVIEKFRKMSNENFFVRLFNVKNYVKNIEEKIGDSTNRSKVVYYRFFVPRIFSNYEKIIYLDSDLVCNVDIAELYDFDIERFCIAAVNDLYMRMLLIIRPNWMSYLKYTLGMEEPNRYFQSGVMIFNVKEILAQNIEEELLNRLREIKEPLIVDQDIYNSVCQTTVKFISPEWNYDRNTELLIKEIEIKDEELEKIISELETIKRSPRIIHYAGSMKPWDYPLISFADIWKTYAEKSPFFGDLKQKYPLIFE